MYGREGTTCRYRSEGLETVSTKTALSAGGVPCLSLATKQRSHRGKRKGDRARERERDKARRGEDFFPRLTEFLFWLLASEVCLKLLKFV